MQLFVAYAKGNKSFLIYIKKNIMLLKSELKCTICCIEQYIPREEKLTMWIISQDEQTIVKSVALTLETSTEGTVLSAYVGDGSVESAFMVGTFQQKDRAAKELSRFRQYLSTINMEPFYIQPDLEG